MKILTTVDQPVTLQHKPVTDALMETSSGRNVVQRIRDGESRIDPSPSKITPEQRPERRQCRVDAAGVVNRYPHGDFAENEEGVMSKLRLTRCS